MNSLKLPPEFDGTISYRDMFRTLSRDRLFAMLDALPVEYLDLCNPGRPPTAIEMGRAITQIFSVAIFMATDEVPPVYGDRLFPRLVAKVGQYNGQQLHLELCDLVRDFATYLAAGKRHRQAHTVLLVLKQSPFWRTFDGDFLLFATLTNLALQTKSPQDAHTALDAVKHLSSDQQRQVGDMVSRLRNIG